MITDLLLILLISVFAFLFWQHRRQNEVANAHIARHCEQLNLQLLSTALMKYHWRLPDGRWRFHAVFQFEFSVRGDDNYTGKMIMIGFRAHQFYLPPYPILN